MSLLTNAGIVVPDWLVSIDLSILVGCDSEVFTIVRSAYESTGRGYHSWKHISACITEFQRHAFDDPQAVLLALLFHDAIYVPGRKDNELKSAELADSVLRRHSTLDDDVRHKIVRMIELTASHHENAGSLTDDEAKLLDIDLSILATPWSIYEAYAKGVRHEYCPGVTSEFKFAVGRMAFLQKLSKQSSIFLTTEMKAREPLARQNIAKELALLGSEIGIVGSVLSVAVR